MLKKSLEVWRSVLYFECQFNKKSFFYGFAQKKTHSVLNISLTIHYLLFCIGKRFGLKSIEYRECFFFWKNSQIRGFDVFYFPSENSVYSDTVPTLKLYNSIFLGIVYLFTKKTRWCDVLNYQISTTKKFTFFSRINNFSENPFFMPGSLDVFFVHFRLSWMIYLLSCESLLLDHF